MDVIIIRTFMLFQQQSLLISQCITNTGELQWRTYPIDDLVLPVDLNRIALLLSS